LYAYCANNPVYYVDPSGNYRQCVKDAFDAIRKANPNMSASAAYDLALKQTGKSRMIPTGLKRWKHFVYFRKNKVYQRNNLFNPNQMTTWTRKKKVIYGTNKQRMAAGNAPIGYDGRPVELHHLLQSQNGPIVEMSATSHDKFYSVIHMNTGQSKSTINRSKFNTWKRNYWKDRARDFK
ncbi:MAG: hypothetical protein OSJ73_25315, partial [Lachnospiraceae bacterium]|nr:hypothetical protein [Lachnospiraceae bacterium]